jgi:REP-associated tyrosine transposase
MRWRTPTCHSLSQRCGRISSFQPKTDTRFMKAEIREQTHAYLAGILRTHDCTTLLVDGVADHVHSLFVLSKNVSIAEIVYQTKRGSSRWIKTQGSEFRQFHWQNGYGAFSVSQSHVEQVRRYIASQEEHHRKVTFQDELREFLKRYEVEYDERYLWD